MIIKSSLQLKEYLALIVVTIVGAMLRFYNLGAEPIWQDEAATLWFAQLPLSHLWGENALWETNPPLYYTLQKFWLIFGESEAGLRSLSAIISTLTIPLMYALGRTLGGHRLGIIAAALLTTSSINIQYAQEARAYALLTLAATLAIWGLACLLMNPAGADSPVGQASIRFLFRNSLDTEAKHPKPITDLAWLAYTLGVSIALYCHNTAVLLPILANIVAFIWWARISRFSKGFFWNWSIANVIPLLIWSWWLPILFQQTVYSLQDFWIPFPTIKGVVGTLSYLYGHPYLGFHEANKVLRWGIDLFIWGLALLGLWRWRYKPIKAILTVSFLLGTPLLAVLISFWRPIFILKIFLWTTIPLLISIASGILTLRSKFLVALLVTVLLTIQIKDTVNYYQYFHKAPWNQVAAYLEPLVKPNDAIFLFPEGIERPFNYYFDSPQSNITQYALIKNYSTRKKPFLQLDKQLIKNLSSVVQPFDRIWLVTNNLEKKDPEGLIFSELRQTTIEIEHRDFDRLQVFLLEKK
ncbi:MAG: glycosyltransferase family 39 protein [Xenococcaceae cyanobacterium]